MESSLRRTAVRRWPPGPRRGGGAHPAGSQAAVLAVDTAGRIGLQRAARAGPSLWCLRLDGCRQTGRGNTKPYCSCCRARVVPGHLQPVFLRPKTHSRDRAHFCTKRRGEKNSPSLIGATSPQHAHNAPFFFRVHLKALNHPKFRPHAPHLQSIDEPPSQTTPTSRQRPSLQPISPLQQRPTPTRWLTTTPPSRCELASSSSTLSWAASRWLCE